MSLEAKIEANTAAILKLIAVLESKQEVAALVSVPSIAQAAPIVAPTASPVAAPVATQVSAAPVIEMPALPTFVAPVPAAAPVSGAPFTDGKGLIAYVMDAYKQMGAEKGAKIQNVLVGLGYQNINDVKPEHYGALHAGVEALK